MVWSRTAAIVYADGPSSDPIEPAKSEIRPLLKQYEDAIDGLTLMLLAAVGAVKGTKAELDAVVGSFANGAVGVVFADTAELNGIYVKTSGAWLRKSALPGYAADAAAAAAVLAKEAAEAAQSAAEAARNTAITYRDQAGVSAANAAGSANAAAASTLVASSSVSAAANYAAQALAAASATGPVTFFDTKAAATAALASIANLAYIEVLTDESRGSLRTRYRKESGALVYKISFYEYARPAADPGRNWTTVCAPYVNDNTFIDNVLAIQNKSLGKAGDGSSIAGNAAINFLDSAGTERAAIGYSRNAAITPGGYYANLLYLEIGNPFTTDAQVTNFAVVLTVAAGGPFYGGVRADYMPIRVDGSNGEISIRSPHSGWTTIHDKIRFGLSGQNICNVEYTLAGTAARFRESGAANQFAMAINDNSMNSANSLGQDLAGYPSWMVSFGIGEGYDNFGIYRAPAGSTQRSAYLPVFKIDGFGRAMINQSAAGPGADGQLSVTSPSQSGRTALTVRNVNQAAIPAQIIWHQAGTGNNQFITFLTDDNRNARGSIGYSRDAGVIVYGQTSDRRAKVIHGEITDAVERLMQVKAYRGRMNDGQIDMDMIIADEFQAVAPYAVIGSKDGPLYQGVDLAKSIPLLIAGFQDHERRLIQLQA
ncbi:hypothetical protein [Neorhizobium sp. DAR64872/K0K18]|uniref:hypothetical protein n=1 Tax=Neorhizobium sp. DAR64872/K0K18 TaxID=3421958 RepID=UPI003D2650A9